jgi:hypothetical protein
LNVLTAIVLNLRIFKDGNLDFLSKFSYKFQAIAIGPKTNRHNLSFDLKGNKITCEENVKLLGITVDSHLNFDKLISEICKKASQQLNLWNPFD